MVKMYLVFDTETSGLPRSWKAPSSAVDNWPRVVQVAWQSYDSNEQPCDAQCHLIRPDGFTIPKSAEQVHGISTEIATQRGIPIAEALAGLVHALSGVTVIIA